MDALSHAGDPPVIAFVDTNVLLHYRSIEDADWLELLAVEAVRLVVAPPVVGELDNKKFEGTAKLRQRAASVIKSLDALSQRGNPIPIRSGVELEILAFQSACDYALHHLDPINKDDQQLACLIQYRERLPETEFIVITADFGMKVKARRLASRVIAPPDEWKLPDDADPNEKKVQELEREIRGLKRAAPLLELAFPDGEQRLTANLSPRDRNPDQVDEGKRKVRQQYPKLEKELNQNVKRPAGGAIALDLAAGMFRVSPEAVDAYNTSLERFYKRHDEWLSLSDLEQMVRSRLVRLDIMLLNTGTKPAEDVEAFLHLPDGFLVLEEEQLPAAPEEPQSPERPKGGFAAIAAGLAQFREPRLDLLMPKFPLATRPDNVSCLKIRETNSYEVSVHVQKVKHGLPEGLDPIFVVFRLGDPIRSFGIEYELHAANLPQPAKGRLDVIVTTSTT